MGKISPLRQLQRIRDLRADNLSRLLSEARLEIAHMAEETKRADIEFTAARARADHASTDKSIHRGDVLTGGELHEVVRKQSVLRAREADAHDRCKVLNDAMVVAEHHAHQLVEDLARARKIAIRTEVSVDLIEAHGTVMACPLKET
jgi:hypothetical protein